MAKIYVFLTLFMTKKLNFLLLFFLLISCLTINACKKEDQSSLSLFLTQKPWKLALQQRFAYVNSILVKTDTLQTKCALTQTLIFKINNSYTYQNYTCDPNNKIDARWSFTSDQLYLNLNSVISVSAIKTANNLAPQNVARIINLGQYSLVFDAGDVNVIPKNRLTDSVIIYRYGFIH